MNTFSATQPKPDIIALFRSASHGQQSEAYRQLGLQALSRWPWGPVQVWATSPAADLLRCRWSSDAQLESQVPDETGLQRLVLEPERRCLQTEAGWWLPVRGRGLLLSALWLGTTSVPSWGAEPCAELLELPELASLALTGLVDARLRKHWAGLMPDLQELEPRDQLRRLLVFALKLLGFEEGNVAILQEEQRDWLKVIAAEGLQRDRVFDLIPATFHPVQQLLRQALPLVLSPLRPYDKLLHLEPVEAQLRERYGTEHSNRYFELLRDVSACVLLPLWSADRVSGVVTLLRLTQGDLQPEQVTDLTLLIREMRLAVARPTSPPAGGAETLPRAPQQLLQRFADRAPADLPNLLFEDLAEQACGLGGCFRTAVTLRLHDEKALTVTNLYPRDRWPAKFRNHKLPFDGEPAATVEAYQTRETYHVRDVREIGTKYLRVPPDDTTVRMTAAIPIQAGARCLGVLALDWNELGAYDDELLEKLRILTDLYAQALVLVNFGTHWNDLEKLLQTTDERPDSEAVLRLLAAATGAEAGALFLTRPGQPRRLFREATLRRMDEWTSDEASYEFGEGITGWIAEHNCILNVPRLDQPELLTKIAPDLRLAAKYHDCAITPENVSNPFLGLPIAIGDELFGVIRLRRTSTRPFSTLDEFLARAFVSRLAASLQRQRNERRDRALSQLQHELLLLSDRTSILVAMEKAVEAELSPPNVLLRGVEPIDGKQFLVPLYASSPVVRQTSPPTLTMGKSVSGWVWERLEPRLVRDMQNPDEVKDLDLVVPLDSEPWRTVLGLPLLAGGKFLGTLVFMDRRPGVYSDADVKFLGAVAEETAGAFARAQEHDRDRLARDLYRVAAHFPYDLLTARAEHEVLEFDLCAALMSSAAATLGAKHYCVALPGQRSGQRSELLNLFTADHCGVPEIRNRDGSIALTLPPLHLSAVEGWLENKPYLILDVTNTQQLYRELTAPADDGAELGSIARLMRERETRLLLLPLWSGADLRALFVFLIPELFWLCHGVADSVAQVLSDVGKMLRLADEYERERKVANTRLLLSLLGHAASRLEHNIREPVFLIRGNLELLLVQQSAARMKELAKEALTDVEKLKEATNQFVRFARQSLGDPQPTDLTQVLREAVNESALPRGRYELDLDGVAAVIDGYHELLVTAFYHLCKNANRALSTRPNGRVTLRLRSWPSGYVVEVIDNGVGMDPETVRRAFEPFFSRYESSGLGLSLAQSAVHAHRGTIEPKSKLGEGTTFIVTLPRNLK